MTLADFIAARLDHDERMFSPEEGLSGLDDWPWMRDRLLRGVAAMRAILNRHHAVLAPGGRTVCDWCSTPDEAEIPWPCPDVIDLLAIWSDHPDYQPEWSSG